MTLPVTPPVQPMLATLARELPIDGYVYEPKWNGFRCLAFRDGSDIDLRSRNQRPFARYFPEIIEALLRIPETRCVLDGELLVITREGFDFERLLARLHPAAFRVALLRNETPRSSSPSTCSPSATKIFASRPLVCAASVSKRSLAAPPRRYI